MTTPKQIFAVDEHGNFPPLPEWKSGQPKLLNWPPTSILPRRWPNKLPTRTALVDTNALIHSSGDNLAAAKGRGWHLTTSPWSFFERLRHLEEPYAKTKGNLVKLQHVEIVDKPLDRLVAERQGSSKPRIWASDLAKEALGRISEARSMEALKGLTMNDAAGNTRTLERSVATISSILATEKMKFQKLVSDVIRVIRSGEVQVSTAEERHQAVLDMLAAGESSFRDTEDLDYEGYASGEEILKFEYIYYAYVVLRAIAQHKAGGDTCAMNDFVDGQICAYVPLDQPIAIITADGKFREALDEVRDLLTDVGMGERAAFTLAHPDLLLQGEPS